MQITIAEIQEVMQGPKTNFEDELQFPSSRLHTQSLSVTICLLEVPDSWEFKHLDSTKLCKCVIFVKTHAEVCLQIPGKLEINHLNLSV